MGIKWTALATGLRLSKSPALPNESDPNICTNPNGNE